MKFAEKINNRIELKFVFKRDKDGRELFYDTLRKIKTLPGRYYNKKNKRWIVPISFHTIEKLKEWGFKIDSNLEIKPKKEIIEKTLTEINKLNTTAYEFQKIGVSKIEAFGGCSLLADDMGLGKTIQALLYLRLNQDLRPAIIITPASVKYKWEYEAEKWLPYDKDIEVINGQTPLKHYPDITIINYDILKDHCEALKNKNFAVIIIDECHKIKNEKAQRTIAIKELSKNIKYKILMTGTPIEHKPIEIFNALNILKPDFWPSKFNFAKRYCDLKHNGFGFNYNGASNLDELHKILTETIMIRRTKDEVLKELPKKQRIIIPVEIENYNEYNYAEENIKEWLEENIEKYSTQKIEAEALLKYNYLKQITSKGKSKEAINWIKDFLESGQKLVVFCKYHKTIDELKKEFNNISVKLDGRDNSKQKNDVVNEFQNNNSIELFIAGIKSGGEGITLTAASNICFIDIGDSPGQIYQCEDRICRIGQKADSLNIYYIIAKNTIEENIIENIDNKNIVVSKMIDGIEVEETKLLKILFKRFNNETMQ